MFLLFSIKKMHSKLHISDNLPIKHPMHFLNNKVDSNLKFVDSIIVNENSKCNGWIQCKSIR